MNFSRREALVLAAMASVSGLVRPAFAADGDMQDTGKLMQPAGLADRPIGPADAKVTVIEYASPTCPHCAVFAVNVYPALKAKYIDSGKIRFILRPFVRNALDAAVFMLAESIENDEGYHTLIETFFKTQNDWAFSQTPKDAIMKVALQFGFTQESFEAALTNQELLTGIQALRDQAVNDFDLTGTPTFYINGKQLSGEKSLEELAAEIDPKLA